MSVIQGIRKINVLIIGASQGIGFGFVRKLLSDKDITKIYATYRRQGSASELFVLTQKEGSIFAGISAKVGSIGDNHLGGWYGYRASKAPLNMFMGTVAIEYSRRCPKTIVVTLHPGTTDTNLSKPFQKNVPPEKLFPVERTVNQLLAVLEELTIEDSGHFFSWDGTRLPW
jgi:NAD(P)-dependent dehydrogenase (short-subunit alcohol dehydrogenase family)